MSAIFSPFRNTYRFLQRTAHEQPVIFWSFLIGSTGPVLVLTVPRIRRSMGYKPAELIPSSYPMPNRPREEITGYDDEE